MNSSRLNRSALNVTALNSSRLNTTGHGAFLKGGSGGGGDIPQPPDGYGWFATASGKRFTTENGGYFLVMTDKNL